MQSFEFLPTPLAGLTVVQRSQYDDARGHFSRLFSIEDLAAVGWYKSVAHINHAYTQQKGTVRGMHFQYPPYAEMKLVICLAGEIMDVAIDVRTGSPTFLHWHGEKLSAANRKALLIPEGFAHGYQALTDGTIVVYFTSEVYAPELEGWISALDERIGIDWPLPVVGLSKRDAGTGRLDENFQGVQCAASLLSQAVCANFPKTVVVKNSS